VRRLKAGFHARCGQPLDGALLGIAHFGTAPVRRCFVAVAVATLCRDAL
jgi:hypothetical protein